LGHELGELTWVNVRIKVVIIIVLRPGFEFDQSKAQVKSREG